jgi:NAD(P)-dependent dehydrogenase (short-subunit alcohol dehydrogenase family)
MGRLDDTIALVVGIGGLGVTTALKFSNEGATVVLAGSKDSGDHELTQIMRATDGLDLFIQTNIFNEQDVQRMIMMIVNRYSRLDYAFNDIASMSIRLERNVPESHSMWPTFQGIRWCLHYELQQMLKQHHGVITSCYCNTDGLQYHNMIYVYPSSNGTNNRVHSGIPQPGSPQTNSFRQLFKHQRREP